MTHKVASKMSENTTTCTESLWDRLSVKCELEQLYCFIESTERVAQAAESVNTELIVSSEANDNTLLTAQCREEEHVVNHVSKVEKEQEEHEEKKEQEQLTTSQMKLVQSLQHQLSDAHSQISELQSKLINAEIEMQCAMSLQEVQEEKLHTLRCEVQDLKQREVSIIADNVKLEEELANVKATLNEMEVHVKSQLANVHDTFHNYFEVEWHNMERNVKICQGEITNLAHDNSALSHQVKELESKVAYYNVLYKDKVNAEKGNKELQHCLDELTLRWSSVQDYFDHCRVNVEEALETVKELESERDELRSTLEESIATNTRWEEKYFSWRGLTNCDTSANNNNVESVNNNIDSNNNSNNNNSNDNNKSCKCILQLQEEEEEEERVQENIQDNIEEAQTSETLINALQCKIVDLALHLEETQKRWELAESVNNKLYNKLQALMEQYQHHSNVKKSVATTKSKEVEVTVMQVEEATTNTISNVNNNNNSMELLCNVNESLSAQLAVCESGMYAIMEVYTNLLEMYTEETFHSYELEMQLAQLHIILHHHHHHSNNDNNSNNNKCDENKYKKSNRN